MGWPERSDGWEDALADRARAMFADTAERHGLRYELDEAAPVEVAITIPAQEGMDFALALWLSGDEFGCGGDHWYANIFPADDEAKWQIITRVVDGLITGEARVALYTALGRAKPYWTEVQLQKGRRWRSVSTGIGCALPPIIRPTILQNGQENRRGALIPAYGTVVVLLIIAVGLFLLLS